MADTPRLSQADREALSKIRRMFQEERATNWGMPEEYAFKYAHELMNASPAEALTKAKQFINELREHNRKEDEKFEQAKKQKEELKKNPISNVGTRGILGYIRRQILAAINGTPFSSLNILEVDSEGLQVYLPFAAVSQRTIKHKDIQEKRALLSVNPPAYLDSILGYLRQFRKNIPIPIGEIVLYEPGSGKTIASAVAQRPDLKLDEIKKALEQLHRVENPYEKHKRLPRVVDLLIYYDLNHWEIVEQQTSAAERADKLDEEIIVHGIQVDKTNGDA
jgi:hypothetical protein